MTTTHYKTHGTCSKSMTVDLNDGIIENVKIEGGCNGNTQGVAILVKGMKAEDAIAKLGGIMCGTKGTSCPDQLSKALRKALDEEAKAKA